MVATEQPPFLLLSFRADWLRREEAIKTAESENRNCWAAVFSIREDGAAGQKPSLFSYVGLEAREAPVVGRKFSLDFPSIELSGLHSPAGFDRTKLGACAVSCSIDSTRTGAIKFANPRFPF